MSDRVFRLVEDEREPSAGGFTGRRPTSRRLRAAMVLAVVVAVGCGPKTESTSATTSEPTGAPTSAVENATNASTPRGEKDMAAGMQMPDAPMPSESEPNAVAGGPAGPGEGGLEMPDIPSDSDGPPPNEIPDTAKKLAALADWQTIESFAKSTGKVTVVDLWSLACEPCLKEFPGLVRLDRTLGTRVTCIGVSLDFDGRKSKPAETYQARVDAFLGSTEATFPNYICQTPNDEVYDRLQLISIPAVLVFDQEGTLVKQFVDGGETKGFGYERDVIPYVEALLDAG
ncbi:MAG: TlpA disulfide reductase family protein [Planctomycetota bacterium]